MKIIKACGTLDPGFKSIFLYTVIGNKPTRIEIANMIKKLNREFLRHEKNIPIVPNRELVNRLINTVLMDEHDELTISIRRYNKL